MKKVLITGIAALSLVGFTACGGSKKDPKPPEVECTSSDQCTDPAKPFCNANGVCVADPNPQTDAGITDAGLDEDAGEQDAGLQCPTDKPYEVNGECSACPTAEQPYKIGDACFAEGQFAPKGGFTEFCDGNVAVYSESGRIAVWDCGDDSCYVRKADDFALCVPANLVCASGDTATKGCASDDEGYEYVVDYVCDIETTTPGVWIRSVDEESADACDVHCLEKATGAECGVYVEGEYEACPADFEESCVTNEYGTFAVWNYSGYLVTTKCGTGTSCAFADDWGVDCFASCTPGEAEYMTCDDEYYDYGYYYIRDCVDLTDAEGNDAGHGLLYVDEDGDGEADYDMCQSGVCDIDTNKCEEPVHPDVGSDCDPEEYAPKCAGNVFLMCDNYEGIVGEACSELCDADLGCLSKWDECTAGDDPMFVCYERNTLFGTFDNSDVYVCTAASNGKSYWSLYDFEFCTTDASCFDTESGSCGDTVGLCDPDTFTAACGTDNIGNYCDKYGFHKVLDCSGANDACVSETDDPSALHCVSETPECPADAEAGDEVHMCDGTKYSDIYICTAMSDGTNRIVYTDDYDYCGAAGCNEETGECNSK